MAIEVAIRYPEISSRSYEHPADRAATSALHAIPLFDRLVKRFARLGVETRMRQMLLGDSVLIGPDQVPELWASQVRAATRLDIADVPPLYVAQHPLVNAMTFGMRSPVVIVSSGLAAGYESDEVEAVLAHELGHVLSDHMTYQTALAILSQLLSGALSEVPLAGLPVRGLYLALLEWHRAAELSCDRAAALAVGDPTIVCRMLMRMAGGALPGMRVEAFVRQATEYADDEDLFARRARFGAELGRTHPFAVRRVRELVTWVQSGDYDRIRDGSYVRRGDEPPASAEFDAAVRHYRERFGGVVERTVGGVSRLSAQVASWLNRDGDDDAGDGGDDDGDDNAGDDGNGNGGAGPGDGDDAGEA